MLVDFLAGSVLMAGLRHMPTRPWLGPRGFRGPELSKVKEMCRHSYICLYIYIYIYIYIVHLTALFVFSALSTLFVLFIVYVSVLYVRDFIINKINSLSHENSEKCFGLLPVSCIRVFTKEGSCGDCCLSKL